MGNDNKSKYSPPDEATKFKYNTRSIRYGIEGIFDRPDNHRKDACSGVVR